MDEVWAKARERASRRSGYSPFRQIAVSAIVAGLLVVFSMGTAAELRIWTTSWFVTFLYLYLAAARAAFSRTHALACSSAVKGDALRRGERAFAVALQAQRGRLVRIAAVVVTIGAAVDAVAATMPDIRIGRFVLLGGLVVWLGWAPTLLAASGLWALEGRLDFALSRARWRRAPASLRSLWIPCALTVLVVTAGAMWVLYRPFIGAVTAIVPSGSVPGLLSALFFAALIAFQLSLQAAFAAQVAPVLRRA